MGAKNPQTDWLFGIHAVNAVLQTEPGRIIEICIQKGRRDERITRIIQRAEQHGVPVQWLLRSNLDQLVGGQHQGVAANCRSGQLRDENYLMQLLDSTQQPPLLLVLDGVTDPHNLGACLRSADAAGVLAVIAPKDNSVGITPVVSKVACGAAETIPFIMVTNLARTLRQLQQRGIWLVGAAGEAESRLYDVDLTGAMAIVMGAEGKGLRRLTRDNCDLLVNLPMAGTVTSLNVSVATGVCLYEAVRQRTLENN